MRRVILLFTLVTVLAMGARSQDNHLSFGVKAGLNFPGMYGQTHIALNSLTKYHAGLLMEYRTNSWFSVSPELLFSVQGAGIRDIQDARYNIYYIMLPVMLKFYPISFISLETGPQFGVAADMTASVGPKSEKMDSGFYNRLEYEWAFGCSVYLNNFFLSSRWAIGMTNVVKQSTLRNYNTQLSIGMKF